MAPLKIGAFTEHGGVQHFIQLHHQVTHPVSHVTLLVSGGKFAGGLDFSGGAVFPSGGRFILFRGALIFFSGGHFFAS